MLHFKTLFMDFYRSRCLRTDCVPSRRVMLLDSPKHTEQLVVRVLTTVISSVNEQQAKNCFNTSKQLGQALVVSCLKEHAEFFTQMLNRCAHLV